MCGTLLHLLQYILEKIDILYHGRQIALDATIVSALRADGDSRERAGLTDGVALRVARARKLVKYHELLASRRCHLLVAAVETGGRWDEQPTVGDFSDERTARQRHCGRPGLALQRDCVKLIYCLKVWNTCLTYCLH